MAECKHEFVGKKDGIYCKKCDLHMTAKEYQESLEAKKPARKRKETADV